MSCLGISDAQTNTSSSSTTLGYLLPPPTTTTSTIPALGDGNNGCPDCPQCFNCMLPGFECLHFANCSHSGQCQCPPGFGGDDCREPRNVYTYQQTQCIFTHPTLYNIVCGALADGRQRIPREDNHCDCPEGWEGINCNGKLRVCIVDYPRFSHIFPL